MYVPARAFDALVCWMFGVSSFPGAMGKDEHVFSHMINIGRFWMFSLYYVVSELWGSVSCQP